MRVDAVVLTALVKEYQSVRYAFDRCGPSREYRGARGNYHIYTVGDVQVAIPDPMGMGVTSAALGTNDALSDLSTKLLLLAGIAGAMRNRPGDDEPPCKLGDIVVSDVVIDYTMDKDKDEVTKDEQRQQRTRISEPRKKEFPLSHAVKLAVQRRLASVSGWHPDRQADRDWADRIDVQHPPERRPSPPGRGGRARGKADSGAGSVYPAVHIGKVLSGNSVLASEEGKRELLAQIDKPAPLAIEMEAAGVARALDRMKPKVRPEFVMVKSLCDWADGDKDDDWHSYCAHVAAVYCVHLIRSEANGLLARDPDEAGIPARELRERIREASECFFRSAGTTDAFLESAANAIRDSAVTEVIDLVDGKYTSDLSTSRQFLIRAKPFFSNATRIYATSIDTVSTFWTNPSTRKEAREYVHSQGARAESASRLFVFSTPKDAHRHARVLDMNCAIYKNVYVCSADHYAQLLKKHIAPHQAETYATRDFAVLDYPDRRSYLAELDGRNLRLDPVDPDSRFIDCAATRALFHEFEAIVAGTFDERHRVLRWMPGFWQQPGTKRRQGEVWATTLEAMFEEKKADVFHTVAFDIEDGEYRDLREMLAHIKYELMDSRGRNESLSERYQIKQIWLTKRLAYSPGTVPRDGLTHGRLHMSMSRSRKYMLMMQFASVPGLEGYYSDKDHSNLRFELYARIDQTLKTLFDSGGRPDRANDPAARAIQYELVEGRAAHKIHRLDFVDDELIEHMVLSEPYNI